MLRIGQCEPNRQRGEFRTGQGAGRHPDKRGHSRAWNDGAPGQVPGHFSQNPAAARHGASRSLPSEQTSDLCPSTLPGSACVLGGPATGAAWPPTSQVAFAACCSSLSLDRCASYVAGMPLRPPSCRWVSRAIFKTSWEAPDLAATCSVTRQEFVPWHGRNFARQLRFDKSQIVSDGLDTFLALQFRESADRIEPKGESDSSP